MATETIALQPHTARVSDALADYWALTKPEINFLIAIATSAGFCLAHPRSDPFPIPPLIHTLVGTVLVASGTGTLNQCRTSLRRTDATDGPAVSGGG